MDHPPLRAVVWVGSSHKDFLRFPTDARDDFVQQLYLVQAGEDAPGEKPLTKGKLKGLGIRELRVDFDRDTYRVVYTVRLTSAIYVLHAFKKKSKFGNSTPAREIDLVRQRYLRAALFDAAARSPVVREQKR